MGTCGCREPASADLQTRYASLTALLSEAGAKTGKEGVPLRKRLSFSRDRKKAPPANVEASAARPAPLPKKKNVDGEMDDDDLEAYLQHLELNHEKAREAFEAATDTE